MNCTETRERLAVFLYGDIASAEKSAVDAHLEQCADCRHDLATLQRLRQALDTAPTPRVNVDLSRIYQEEAALQARRARRWRRIGLAIGSATAVLLVLLLLGGLELRVEGHQATIRWGAVPPAPTPKDRDVPSDPAAVERQGPSPELEKRIRVLTEIVHALARDVDSRDQQQKVRLARLQAELDDLQFQSGRRLSATERSVAALYTATFKGPPRKEEENE